MMTYTRHVFDDCSCSEYMTAGVDSDTVSTIVDLLCFSQAVHFSIPPPALHLHDTMKC